MRKIISIALCLLLVFTIFSFSATRPAKSSPVVGVTNTGGVGYRSSLDGDLIAFETLESEAGDLNDDDDTNDHIIRYYDKSTGSLRNTGVIGYYPSIYGNLIAFHTLESDLGVDINNDTDTADPIVRYYDISAGDVVSTREVGEHASVYGNLIAFSTYESDADLDLNNDGDKSDHIIRYYDKSKGTVKNTTTVGENPSIYGDIIAFETYESDAGVDLNGDGDLTDHVIRYYDTSTGDVTNTGAEGTNPFIYGNLIAFFTSESEADSDLNGDGDKNDHVIRYYDTSSKSLKNTGAIGRRPSIYGNLIAFDTYESDAGDLNDDGDTNDHIIRYYDVSTETVKNTAAVGENPSIYGDIIAFETLESEAGDLNDDDDTGDHVIRYYNPDVDGDGLSNEDEAIYGTDPEDSDTDDDELPDNEEIDLGADPLKSDTDNDGLNDGSEINVHGTDPLNNDSDEDGLNDGDEVTRGTDPVKSDTDGDGLLDGEDPDPLTPLPAEVTPTPEPPRAEFPTLWVLGGAVAVVAVVLVTYLLYRRRTRGAEEGPYV